MTPVVSLACPMPSSRNVTVSSAKTTMTAPDTRIDATNMYAVKMPQPIRYRPTEWASCALSVMSFAKNCSNAQNDSQNAPYDVNAVEPNVLPVRNSHIPASSCASPPYASASPSTTGSPLVLTNPALNMLSTKGVIANPARPRGAGLSGIQPLRAGSSATAGLREGTVRA